MTKVFIQDLDKVGIVTDSPPHRIPLQGFSAGENIVFRDGGVSRAQGIISALSTPSITPYFLQPWRTASGPYWIYGNSTALWRTDGTSHVDVTNTSGAYGGPSWPRWTGGILNGIPILNVDSSADYPQQWDSGTGKFIDLTNWPSGWYCQRIRPFKNFLIALDMTRAGTQYPWEIRWSSSAPPGAVPSYWQGAPGNDAGTTNALAETDDYIVDCLPLGAINAVYKENSVWAQEYIGGNQVFSHHPKFKEFGLIAPNCVREIFGQHFVVTQDDVVLHNMVEAKSVIDEITRRRLFSILDKTYSQRCCVVVAWELTSVLILVPGNDGIPTNLFIWNWKNNSWTYREIPATTFITSGDLPTSSGLTFDSSSGTTFDNDSGVFDERANSSGRVLVTARYDTPGFGQMQQDYTYFGTDYTSYVERTGIAIAGQDRAGSPIIDENSIKLCNGVFPIIEADPGVTIDVSFGMQENPNTAVVWSGSKSFNPATDTKVDFNQSGRLAAVRFSSSSGNKWKLTGYGLDIKVISRF